MTLNQDANDRLDILERDILNRPNALFDAIPADRVERWRPPHIRTIELRRRHTRPVEAARDQRFLDSLGETLRAWSWERPGAVNATEFETQIRQAAERLDFLNGIRIEDITDHDVDRVARELWECIGDLVITRRRARLVFGTKAIHHLLPDLIPPMDRRNTGRFFRRNWATRRDEERVFRDIFPDFVRLARRCAPQLRPFIRPDNFNTSIPKTLDNAIIGFMSRA